MKYRIVKTSVPLNPFFIEERWFFFFWVTKTNDVGLRLRFSTFENAQAFLKALIKSKSKTKLKKEVTYVDDNGDVPTIPRMF